MQLQLQNCVELSDIASTFVIENDDATSKVKYSIFAVSSMPPVVYEITMLENELESPFVSISYQVTGDSLRYIALPAVKANQFYIVVQLLDYETFSPVLRIYKRGAASLSFAHAQVSFDSALIYQPYFTAFLASFDNTFLIQTEQSIDIYYINQRAFVAQTNSLSQLTLQQDYARGHLNRFYVTLTTTSKI